MDCNVCAPGPGFRQEAHQYSRSSEYTTGMLLANGAGDLDHCGSLADIEWGRGRVWGGTNYVTRSAATAALRNLSSNEDQIAFTKIGYRFKVVGLQTGQIYRLNWVECFTPEGSTNTTVLRTRTMVFRGTSGTQSLESAEYAIDPPETDGVIEPVVLNVPKVDIRVDDSDPNSCYLNTVDSVDHVVTIKGAGDVILKAILDPDTPEIRNQLTWEGAVQQADKITAKISRSATVKHVVHARVGGNASREGNIWVVWTQIDTLNTTGPTPSDSGVDPFSIPGVPPFDYGASGNYGTVPGVDNRFQNGILLRGTILPTSFSNRNGLVQFRFIRTKEKCGWAKWHDTGWAQRPPGYVSPGEPDGPSDVTEDLIPSSQDHIYNVDGPGISGPVDLWDEAVHRVNLSQHIEILLPCRAWATCSDDVEWFSTVWIEKGADGNFHRRSTENAIGAGHITVGSGSEPP